MVVWWPVPRLWSGETVACLGGGPSLTQEDVDRLRGRIRVIAINDAWRLAPWADVLYGCDWRWWVKHRGVPDFAGLKLSLSNSHGHLGDYPEIRLLENTGVDGLELRRSGLRTGRNGGYQAINLAVHLGARRILLLGYDMQAATDGRTHWFGDHAEWPTRPSVYATAMLPHFAGLAAALHDAGIETINCTPGSALTAFPMADVETALADSV